MTGVAVPTWQYGCTDRAVVRPRSVATAAIRPREALSASRTPIQHVSTVLPVGQVRVVELPVEALEHIDPAKVKAAAIGITGKFSVPPTLPGRVGFIF